LSGLALGVVIAIVALYMGLYMISQVSSVQDESVLKDYSYTTITNSTQLTLNNSINQSHALSIGAFASIDGETPIKTLKAVINNTNANTDFVVNVYLNTVSLGTITAENNTVTEKTFDNVNWVESAVNNVTYNTNTTSADVFVESSTAKYPSGKTDTDFGKINTSLTTNISTIFDVMILVIIIFALGVAIGVLKGFTGAAGGTTSEAI